MAAKTSEQDRKEAKKKSDFRDFYDSSCEHGKSKTITQVAKEMKMHLTTYKSRLLDCCITLQVKPPIFLEARKLPKNFIDKVWSTEKTKLLRLHLPQAVYSHLGCKSDDYILFTIEETKPKGIKKGRVILEKYNEKAGEFAGPDLSKLQNHRKEKEEKKMKQLKK